MKSKLFGLNNDVVYGIGNYDKTKTTAIGNITQKTINSREVLGPPLNCFMDIVADSTPFGAAVPNGQFYISRNLTGDIARVFILGTETLGLSYIYLYNFNIVDGSKSYVGKIGFRTADTAATTTTTRGFKVDDAGTTGWSVFVLTTGSVLINGGLYLGHKVDLADFTPSGTLLPTATGNDQKACYFLQDPAGVGSAHIMTAGAGLSLDTTNKVAYVHNGLSATHQYWVFDYTAAPTYATNSVTGVAATDIITDTGHQFVNGDPVVFTALTGGAGLTVGTVYFVVNSVAGVSYQLSATSVGAAINFTTDITAGTVGRAFGISTNNFLHKTGNLPALTGTLLLTNSEYFATPAHGGPLVEGFDCVAFMTSSQLYFGRLSELTNGATTWPSLTSANLLGAANEVTAVTAANGAWGQLSDRFYYTTNTALIYGKQCVNNVIDIHAGYLSTEYVENTTPDAFEFAATTIISLDIYHGWLMFMSTTVGQRGVFAHHIRSNSFFDYSYIISPVIKTDAKLYQLLGTMEELFDYTSPMVFYYRTSGFDSASGGWTQVQVASDISGIAVGDEIQFKIAFNPPDDGGTNASQIHDLAIDFIAKLENSEHWAFDNENSTKSNQTPAKSAGILEITYDSVVPAMAFRAYSRASGALVIEKFTDTHAAEFEYSSNNGTSWNALGTIPNVANTTRLRYNWATPIPTDVDIVWQEK